MWELVVLLLTAVIPVLVKVYWDGKSTKKALDEMAKTIKESDDSRQIDWIEEAKKVNRDIDNARQAKTKWKR